PGRTALSAHSESVSTPRVGRSGTAVGAKLTGNHCSSPDANGLPRPTLHRTRRGTKPIAALTRRMFVTRAPTVVEPRKARLPQAMRGSITPGLTPAQPSGIRLVGSLFASAPSTASRPRRHARAHVHADSRA